MEIEFNKVDADVVTYGAQNLGTAAIEEGANSDYVAGNFSDRPEHEIQTVAALTGNVSNADATHTYGIDAPHNT